MELITGTYSFNGSTPLDVRPLPLPELEPDIAEPEPDPCITPDPEIPSPLNVRLSKGETSNSEPYIITVISLSRAWSLSIRVRSRPTAYTGNWSSTNTVLYSTCI